MEPFKISLSVSLLGYEEELENNKYNLESVKCYNNLFKVAENCDYVHVDIIRDDFASGINRFISPLYLNVYNLLEDKSKFEFHFMLNNAIPHINYMNFKIDKKKRNDITIILPIESNRKPDKSLELIAKKDNDLFDIAEKIAYVPLKRRILELDQSSKKKVFDDLLFVKQCGYKIGIAIEPNTSLTGIISNEVFDIVDYILFMGVSSGKGGQEYQRKVTEKINAFSANSSKINIGVDGGVNFNLISEVIKAGADSIVVGSYITNSEDVKSAISDIKGEINKTIDEIIAKPEIANKRIAYLANFS